MKKILAAAVIIILLTTALTGCTPPQYARISEHQAWIVAIHAPMLESNGEGEVLEADRYGRELFVYTPDSGGKLFEYTPSDIHFYGICQSYNDDTVYCYEDYCFLLSREEYLLENNALENLKRINDWDAPLSLEKASNVKTPDTWNGPDYDWVDAGKIVSNYILAEGDEEDNLQAINVDGNGKQMFFSTIRSATDIRRYYFVLLHQVPHRSEPCFFEVQDIFNYAEQLHEFKEDNEWKFS